jgi:hypothetical protein
MLRGTTADPETAVRMALGEAGLADGAEDG